MKSINLVILFLLAGCSAANAQNFAWAKGFSNVGNNEGFGIVSDDSGNVYSTGYFEDTALFNPAGSADSAIGEDNLYILKLNAAGGYVWVKTIGRVSGSSGVAYASGECITRDRQGNIIVGGYFSGSVDFDPGSGTSVFTSGTGSDGFILKLDPNGNFLWAKQIDGAYLAIVSSITVDGKNDVIATGHFDESADFDPGTSVYTLSALGGDDAFVLKLSSAGDFVWAKQMGGLGDDWGFGAATDQFGNILTTGYFFDTADFDPGTGVHNLITNCCVRDIYISKLDPDGNFIWAKQMGSWNNEDMGYGIVADKTGNVYTTGAFQGTGDFDPGTGTYFLTSVGGTYDVFISKLDSNGNFIWAKRIGGADGSDVGMGITIDKFNNVYATGGFIGTVNFNPGAGTFNLSSVGTVQYDVFVSQLDSGGNFMWAGGMGGAGSDIGCAINVDLNGNIYFTGAFEDTANFDPGTGTCNLIDAGGGGGIFVEKLSKDVTGIPIISNSQPAMSLYPNPSSGQFTLVASGFESQKSASITIMNILGATVYTTTTGIHDGFLKSTIEMPANLPNGLYLLEMTNDGKSQRQRFVLQR